MKLCVALDLSTKEECLQLAKELKKFRHMVKSRFKSIFKRWF